jgi:hypothetical protein
MYRKFMNLLATALMLAASFLLPAAAKAAAANTTGGAPAIDKTTLIIRPRTHSHYYDKNNNHVVKWGWTPELDFRVNGPLASGSVFEVEITTPDGKPWFSFDCQGSGGEVKEDETSKIGGCGRNLPGENSSNAVGLYGLKISLKNELQGVSQTLMTGKFKVGKVFLGQIENNKEHYNWYVDYDWLLPVAEVYAREPIEVYGNLDDSIAPLVANFWFRGDTDSRTEAYLFYNGREISNTADSSKGASLGATWVATSDGSTFLWSRKQFTFTNTLVYNREDPDNHPDAFRMDKNPGEYEIKVLRKGKLVRALKFTVGADGKITDNGIARQNSLGTRRMIVAAQVSGDEDGAKPDLEAWKTGAFFNSPLKGFNQQQQ